MTEDVTWRWRAEITDQGKVWKICWLTITHNNKINHSMKCIYSLFSLIDRKKNIVL